MNMVQQRANHKLQHVSYDEESTLGWRNPMLHAGWSHSSVTWQLCAVEIGSQLCDSN